MSRSFRVEQIAGMFDLPVHAKSAESFSAEVPDASEEWQIGLIVGPSGSGKTTIARQAFGLYSPQKWPRDKSILDGFDQSLETKQIVQALNAVGLSSAPAYVRPFHVLSNGQQFRCELARALTAGSPLIAFDEFTSVVDRTVAKIGSVAVAKAIRRTQMKFVAVSCHYDIKEWLEPDWVLDMSTQQLDWRRLRRPKISLSIHEGDKAAWSIFHRHHYLSGDLNRSARVFLAYVDMGEGETLAGFFAILAAMKKGWRRGHRTVILPDFQGIGLGNVMIELVAEQLYRGEGLRFTGTTSSPSINAYRRKHPDKWLWNGGLVFKAKSQSMTDRSPKTQKASVWRTPPKTSAGRATLSWTYIPEEMRLQK